MSEKVWCAKGGLGIKRVVWVNPDHVEDVVDYQPVNAVVFVGGKGKLEGGRVLQVAR